MDCFGAHAPRKDVAAPLVSRARCGVFLAMRSIVRYAASQNRDPCVQREGWVPVLQRIISRSLSSGGASRRPVGSCGAAPGTQDTCIRPLATQTAPELCINFVPRKTEGAGKTGCPMHPQPRMQNEKAYEVVTTGSPERSGLPCAMVLTASFALSLVTGLFCHHRQRNCFRQLDASVGASGPRDFTVRERHALVKSAGSRPPHPAPTSVTCATPSRGTGWPRYRFDLGGLRSRIFFEMGLDSQIADLPVGCAFARNSVVPGNSAKRVFLLRCPATRQASVN